MITLHLTRGKDLEGIYIRLPSPKEKIEETMARLNAISEDILTVTNRDRMMRILSVSHGIICKSPVAEFVIRNLTEKGGMEYSFHVASATVKREEIGNLVYPSAQKKLAVRGISCAGHVARQLTSGDYAEYDLLIGMDQANVRNMRRIFCGDPEEKIHLLMEYAGQPGQEVADPWYTGDFESTWKDVSVGCQGLVEHLVKGTRTE